MTTIKIGFSKPKKWKPFAALIMAGYGIPYDHVYLELYSVKYDRKMIYQASGARVNFMGYELFHEENDVIAQYTVELEDAQYAKLMQFAIDNSGRPYGVKQAVGMAIVRIAEILGRKIKNPFADGSNTFVCSELGAFVLQTFDNIKFSDDQDDITPQTLWNYFQSVPSDAPVDQLPTQPVQ